MTLDQILEQYPDEGFLRADHLDNAVIGIEYGTMRLVYSVEKCIDIMVKDQNMDRDEAIDFLEFNTFGTFAGERTPVWVIT